MDLRERITIEPGKRGGKPCVRGLRIMVYDVLGWLAAGMQEQEFSGITPILSRTTFARALPSRRSVNGD